MLHANPTSAMRALLAVSLMALPTLGQNCTDFAPTDFKKVVLASGLDSPMKLGIAKDGRVFFIQRSGKIRMLKPGNTTPVDLLTIGVKNGANNEDGVLGMALDPKFESNNFLFVFYSASTAAGYKISRFTLAGESLGNEKVLLTIPHAYPSGSGLVIHGAGGMGFDKDGNLLVGTGDLMVTNGTGGPTPTDPNSSNFDAQKTSANSNNYLGKILRIHPNDAGDYSIPAGNLFASGTAKTLPEIFAMGMRNPFTLTTDPKTGWAYVGEVGPDGATGNPASQDEVNQIKAAGNYGWPYLTGDNQAYPGFSADKLTNNSKNNTGIADLPAPVKSLFWMGMTKSSPINGFFPKSQNVGSRCIKVGGFYRFNPAGTNAARLPPYFDGGLFVANHNQFDSTEPVRFFKLTEAGELSAIKVFQNTFRLPMAFEIAPDGVLYGVEWGTDNGHWFNGSNGPDGRILRIEYTGTCSATGIKGIEKVLGGYHPITRTVYPGQAIEFPSGAMSADIYGISGKYIGNLRKEPYGNRLNLPTSPESSLLLVKFRSE